MTLWFITVPGKLEREFYCESTSVEGAFALVSRHLGWPSLPERQGEVPTASAVNMFEPSARIKEILAREGVYEIRNDADRPPSQSLMPF